MTTRKPYLIAVFLILSITLGLAPFLWTPDGSSVGNVNTVHAVGSDPTLGYTSIGSSVPPSQTETVGSASAHNYGFYSNICAPWVPTYSGMIVSIGINIAVVGDSGGYGAIGFYSTIGGTNEANAPLSHSASTAMSVGWNDLAQSVNYNVTAGVTYCLTYQSALGNHQEPWLIWKTYIYWGHANTYNNWPTFTSDWFSYDRLLNMRVIYAGSLATTIYGYKYQVTTDISGAMTEMSWYHYSGTGHVTVGLYDDNATSGKPKNLLWSSASISVSGYTNTWIIVSYASGTPHSGWTGTFTLSTWYWLVFTTDDVLGPGYYSGTSNYGVTYHPGSYGSLPSSWGTVGSLQNYGWSQYVTYSVPTARSCLAAAATITSHTADPSIISWQGRTGGTDVAAGCDGQQTTANNAGNNWINANTYAWLTIDGSGNLLIHAAGYFYGTTPASASIWGSWSGFQGVVLSDLVTNGSYVWAVVAAQRYNQTGIQFAIIRIVQAAALGQNTLVSVIGTYSADYAASSTFRSSIRNVALFPTNIAWASYSYNDSSGYQIERFQLANVWSGTPTVTVWDYEVNSAIPEAFSIVWGNGNWRPYAMESPIYFNETAGHILVLWDFNNPTSPVAKWTISKIAAGPVMLLYDWNKVVAVYWTTDAYMGVLEYDTTYGTIGEAYLENAAALHYYDLLDLTATTNQNGGLIIAGLWSNSHVMFIVSTNDGDLWSGWWYAADNTNGWRTQKLSLTPHMQILGLGNLEQGYFDLVTNENGLSYLQLAQFGAGGPFTTTSTYTSTYTSCSSGAGYDYVGAANNQGWTANGKANAIPFTATQDQVVGISLDSALGGTPANWVVKIYSNNATSSDHPLSILISGSGTITTIGWNQITFSSPLSTTIGQKYWAVFEIDYIGFPLAIDNTHLYTQYKAESYGVWPDPWGAAGTSYYTYYTRITYPTSCTTYTITGTTAITTTGGALIITFTGTVTDLIVVVSTVSQTSVDYVTTSISNTLSLTTTGILYVTNDPPTTLLFYAILIFIGCVAMSIVIEQSILALVIGANLGISLSAALDLISYWLLIPVVILAVVALFFSARGQTGGEG